MVVGIGVDIVQIDRIERLLERHGDRFLARVMTDGERAYCARHKNPTPSIAARFAAKEAVLKALGTGWSGGIRWQDVEVVRGDAGPPVIALHGAAAAIAAGKGVVRTHLSLAHDAGAAVATVVLESE